MWVHGPARIGEPTPGVVVCWQHAPVHGATAAAWVALVAQCPVPGELLLAWVSADRLVGVRDDTAADA